MNLNNPMQHDSDQMRSSQMHGFILASEDYVRYLSEVEMEMAVLERLTESDDAVPLMEDLMVANVRHPVMDDLHDVCRRLRAYMENAGGEYALGVETGMERAAEMIENLIKRHEVSNIGQ